MSTKIEQAIRSTSHKSCPGVDGTSNMGGVQIMSVLRIENMLLWKQFWHKHEQIRELHKVSRIHRHPLDPQAPAALRALNEGLLDEQLNEFYLWHGTDPSVAKDIIAQHGFDERICKTT